MPRSSTPREFRAFYRDHYGFVWAAVRRFGVPPAWVDDATQDAFVVAYRRHAELRGSPRPWLYGIARGVASNYRRSARRVERKRKAIAHATSPAAAIPREPQALLRDLDRFLDELPDRDRELFVLSEVEGLTGPELAAALGCNKSTAYGRVRSLRQRFAQHGGGDELVRREREERPRATAQGWALLLPSLRMPEPGWLGLGSTGTSLVAAALGGTLTAVVMGLVVVSRPPAEPSPAARPTAIVDAHEPPLRSPEAGVTPADHEPTPNDHEPLALPEEPATSTSSPPPSATTTRAAPPHATTDEASGDDLAEQNALLQRATRALAEGDPARALAATHDHALRFPGSPLEDLRTALRVEALCAQGNHAQARGEARAWAAAHPQSPTRQRILDACPARSASAGQQRG